MNSLMTYFFPNRSLKDDGSCTKVRLDEEEEEDYRYDENIEPQGM